MQCRSAIILVKAVRRNFHIFFQLPTVRGSFTCTVRSTGSEKLCVLIRWTRHSVRYPRQAARHSTELSKSRTKIEPGTLCEIPAGEQQDENLSATSSPKWRVQYFRWTSNCLDNLSWAHTLLCILTLFDLIQFAIIVLFKSTEYFFLLCATNIKLGKRRFVANSFIQERQLYFFWARNELPRFRNPKFIYLIILLLLYRPTDMLTRQ